MIEVKLKFKEGWRGRRIRSIREGERELKFQSRLAWVFLYYYEINCIHDIAMTIQKFFCCAIPFYYLLYNPDALLSHSYLTGFNFFFWRNWFQLL